MIIPNTNNKFLKILKYYMSGKKNNDIIKTINYFNRCIIHIENLNISDLDKQYVKILDDIKKICKNFISTKIIDRLDIHISYNSIKCNDIFDSIEIGDINYLKKFKLYEIDFKIYNDNGFTPLHNAIRIGDSAFLKNAFIIGGYIDETSKNGLTLLELACVENDPNMINFLLNCGADMKKHILFRQGNNFINRFHDIDMALLQKYILLNQDDNTYKCKYMNSIFKYFTITDNIPIQYDENYMKLQILQCSEISIKYFIECIDYILNKLSQDTITAYISILEDELSYNLINDLSCPYSKIEILIYYLLPFINYDIRIKTWWIIHIELKYIIYYIIKEYNYSSLVDLQKYIFMKLKPLYIDTELLSQDLLYILIFQMFGKLKV